MEELAQIHGVIHGILPCAKKVQITNRLQVWPEVFLPAQGDGPSAEYMKEEGSRKRVSRPHMECEAIGLCFSGRRAAECQINRF